MTGWMKKKQDDNMVSVTARLIKKNKKKTSSQEAIKGFPNNWLEDACSFPQQI